MRGLILLLSLLLASSASAQALSEPTCTPAPTPVLTPAPTRGYWEYPEPATVSYCANGVWTELEQELIFANVCGVCIDGIAMMGAPLSMLAEESPVVRYTPDFDYRVDESGAGFDETESSLSVYTYVDNEPIDVEASTVEELASLADGAYLLSVYVRHSSDNGEYYNFISLLWLLKGDAPDFVKPVEEQE